MNRFGLGQIEKIKEEILFPTGEVRKCEVIYRLGWLFKRDEDRLVIAYIPVEVSGIRLTGVEYTKNGWTANECSQFRGMPPREGVGRR